MGKPFILYHAACQDGFGAAFAAWLKFGSNADYMAMGHGDPAPGVKGRDVFILDYSFKRDVTLELEKKADSLMVLDHHVSAQQDLEGLECAIFDLSKSGARLAWEYFHPETEVPELILNIEDRDLWNWQIEGSKALTAAIETHPYRFPVWKNWLDNGLDTLRTDGAAILRYQEQMIRRVVRKPDTLVIAGHKVPAVNSPLLASELGNVLCKGKPFAVIWREIKGVRSYSLRSDEKGQDVSLIAGHFGGGGHPRAAGFSVSPDVDISQVPVSESS